MCRAVIKRRFGTAKLLMDHGAELNAVDKDEKTILHDAFDRWSLGVPEQVQLKAIGWLIANGVNVNATDKFG